MNGKEHDKVTKYLCPSVAFGVAIAADTNLGFIAGAAELFGGLMLSPDLDIKSYPFYRWGLLQWYWLPYQKLIPHRHWLSHSVLIGSIVRLAYLLFPVIVFVIATNNLGIAIDWVVQNPVILIAIFLGIEISAIAHLICDKLGDRINQKKKLKSMRLQTK
jgi:uncharacterized metal-binding protein